MAFTLSEATEFYTLWKDAYIALAAGKSYTISTGGTNRSLTRQDLPNVKAEMQYWKNQIDKINNNQSGIKKKFSTPIDTNYPC